MAAPARSVTELVPPRPSAMALVWLAYQHGAPTSHLEIVVLDVLSDLGPWNELDVHQQSWCNSMVWASLGYYGMGINGADAAVVAEHDREAYERTAYEIEDCPRTRDDVTPQELNARCERQREHGPRVEDWGEALRIMRRMPGWGAAMREEAPAVGSEDESCEACGLQLGHCEGETVCQTPWCHLGGAL
ncbi:MAG: hypothetical protein JWN04_4038 [Myxococcaceae bacterium]|nr:hypothetical protein [Myxococcaceae bacterium]